MFRWPGTWQAAKLAIRSMRAQDTPEESRGVLFGRDRKSARWKVHSAGTLDEIWFEGRPYQFVAYCPGDEAHWGRRLVTIFDDKWMVYDRYGQFRYEEPQPCGSSPTAGTTSSTGEEQAGPVPHTVYVDGSPTDECTTDKQTTNAARLLLLLNERHKCRHYRMSQARLRPCCHFTTQKNTQGGSGI